jgi:hypothetical protein
MSALTDPHPLKTDTINLSESYVVMSLSYDHDADIAKRNTTDELDPVHFFISFLISSMMNSYALPRTSNGP